MALTSVIYIGTTGSEQDVNVMPGTTVRQLIEANDVEPNMVNFTVNACWTQNLKEKLKTS